jgi:hypothetical protein
MTREVVIVSAARTPIGAFQGVLSPLTAPQLGSLAIKAALERAGVDGKDLHEVLMGCVLPAGQGQAPARQASRGAGRAGPRRLRDDQQGVRLGAEGGDARGPGDPRRRRGDRAGGRDGEHVERAVPAAPGARRLPPRQRHAGRRAGARRAVGPVQELPHGQRRASCARASARSRASARTSTRPTATGGPRRRSEGKFRDEIVPSRSRQRKGPLRPWWRTTSSRSRATRTSWRRCARRSTRPARSRRATRRRSTTAPRRWW